jgi:inorganic pyrophosphatase
MHQMAAFDPRGDLRVVVECPRGSRVKLKYDPELGAFRLLRPLTSGLSFPFDWGFVPGTLAPDGDPLDAILFHDVPTYPGVVVAANPVAVLKLTQSATGNGRERNDRIIVVPAGEARRGDTLNLDARMRAEIERFCLSVTAFLPKHAELEGWEDAAYARRLIKECQIGTSLAGEPT